MQYEIKICICILGNPVSTLDNNILLGIRLSGREGTDIINWRVEADGPHCANYNINGGNKQLHAPEE